MSAIVISPFSNSDIRDWPLEHYVSLIRILLQRWPGTGLIRVIGTKTKCCVVVKSYARLARLAYLTIADA